MVRVEVDRRTVTPERAMAGHDAMVDALLGVTRGLAASLQAQAAASSARLLLAVAAASPPPSACPPGWSRPGCRCRPDRT
jgi:hypothetical protein